MPRSALHESTLLAAAIASLLALAPLPAAAGVCDTVPTVDDTACESTSNTIDGYKDCYEALYEENVIPVFQFLAQCSHDRAEAALRTALETTGALVTGAIRASLRSLESVLTSSNVQTCMQQMNGIGAALAPVLAAEAAAPDLPAYRRTHYSFPQLVSFTDLLLAARQNRSSCSATLLEIREQLELLRRLKAHHLDYCGVLESNATYDEVAKVSSLGQWTAVDPQIDFDEFLQVSVTWNSQCASFDIDGDAGSGSINYTPCAEATVEYRNVLTALDDSLAGWLGSHRSAIMALTAATVSTVLIKAGYVSWAGPMATAAALVIGAAISAFQYFGLREDLEELEDLIAAKEHKLRTIVARDFITEAQFAAKRSELCASWRGVIDHRVATMLASFDPQAHLQKIDGYFQRSDQLQAWYNDLFLWALEPGPSGARFLDEVAEDDLLQQRDALDAEIFATRTQQEVAAQKNAMLNQRAPTQSLVCTGLPSSARRAVQAQLRAGLSSFTTACKGLAAALARQTAPLAFSASTTASDVRCAYSGFREDLASLEIQRGNGFAAIVVAKSATGEVLATAPDVSSALPRQSYGLPGLFCSSPTNLAFGTSEANRLSPGAYPLALGVNIYGFDDAAAAGLRAFLKDSDERMRLKATSCNRQLGAPITLPRTADACGIPIQF